MSPPTARVDRPDLRVTRSTVTLLALAALAWAGSVTYARRLGNAPGTMGMSLGAFLAMWTSMMAAMMLPAVAPITSAYVRTITSNRGLRLSLFVGSYLLVWTAVGIPVYGALRSVDHVVGNSDTMARNIAAWVLIAVGLYQLSPLTSRCLERCGSSVAQLSRDDVEGGPLDDLRAGLHHGVSCVACCWALMALLIAFGVMNVWAMVALAAAVVAERLSRRGQVVRRWAGYACVLLAVLVLASPLAADALVPSTGSMSTTTMTGA